MAYSGVLNDIKKCMNKEKPSKLPFFACSEEFDVRVAGLVYSDYNSNSKIMAECQIRAIREFDYDWAWLQVDDCIEFEVLGVGVQGSGNILPATCDYLPPTYETLRSLKLPDPKKDGRMPVLLDAIKRIKDELGESVCVTGRIAAPFSAVTLIYGMMDSLMMLYDEPALFRKTCEFAAELMTMFGIAQIESGADALWIGDCNASGHLISVGQYNEFAAEPVARCIREFERAGGISMYHASEHDPEHIRAQLNTGIDIISVGPGIDIAEAKKVLNETGMGCLTGNIDPINVLLYETPENVTGETKRIVQIGMEGSGYIFNSGEMVPRETPKENMRAMVEAVREWGAPGI